MKRKKKAITRSKQKKPNSRELAKYAGIEKKYTLRSRQDLLDMDYIDKLNDKEKDWLSRFTDEYTGANFKHPGKIINKKKSQKKACYDSNNARNRDQYTKAKSGGIINQLQEDYVFVTQKPLDEQLIDNHDIEVLSKLNQFINSKRGRKLKQKMKRLAFKLQKKEFTFDEILDILKTKYGANRNNSIFVGPNK